MKVLACLCALANLCGFVGIGFLLWVISDFMGWDEGGAELALLNGAAILIGALLAAPAVALLFCVTTGRLRGATLALVAETVLGLVVFGIALSASSSSDGQVVGYGPGIELTAACAVWFAWIDAGAAPARSADGELLP